MHKRTAFLVLLCGLCSQSQPPSPTPLSKAQKEQSKSAGKNKPSPNQNDQSGAISSSIDKLTSEIRSWKEKQDAPPQESQTFGDWWLKWGSLIAASVSAIAALVTAGLIGIQSVVMHKQRLAMEKQTGHMESMLGETKKTAEAAALSANTNKEALEVLERAEVSIGEIRINPVGAIVHGTELVIVLTVSV